MIFPLNVQVGLTSSQISSLKSHMIPEIQEVTTASLLVHWLTVTFAEVPPSEDFSSQLSSLRLGKYCVSIASDWLNLSRQNDSESSSILNFWLGTSSWLHLDGTSNRAGSGRIGSGDLTLGELLVSAFLESSNPGPSLPEGALPSQDKLLAHSLEFVNRLLSGENGNSSQGFSGRAISLSNILLQYGQYSSLEVTFVWTLFKRLPIHTMEHLDPESSFVVEQTGTGDINIAVYDCIWMFRGFWRQ